MAAGRRRIFVALEPTVLEGAFAALLQDGERSEVVQYHEGGAGDPADHYDAAIVTPAFVHRVDSELLIVLPGTEAGAGRQASLTVGGVTRPVSVGTNAQLADLLAEWFPAEFSEDD